MKEQQGLYFKKDLEDRMAEFRYDWTRANKSDAVVITFSPMVDPFLAQRTAERLIKDVRPYHPMVLISHGEYKIEKMTKSQLIVLRDEIEKHLKERDE